jgi:hypothetical protein
MISLAVITQVAVSHRYIGDGRLAQSVGLVVMSLAFAAWVASGFSCMFSLLTLFLFKFVRREEITPYIKASPLRLMLWDEVLNVTNANISR